MGFCLLLRCAMSFQLGDWRDGETDAAHDEIRRHLVGSEGEQLLLGSRTMVDRKLVPFCWRVVTTLVSVKRS